MFSGEGKVTIMAHKTNGKESVIYYITDLPEWWEFALVFTGYSIIAMTVFYAGLWIASRYMSPHNKY
tara:strand:+ start:141 stop:341 length:201 start_codon:yes stop_codon:yes gene_type:complete